MTAIRKTRREWFGGLVYSENPGFTAFVDDCRADALDIPRVDDLTPGLFSAPLDVHMSITTRCNLQCRGCYALDHDEPAEDMDMPLDLAKTIIDRLSDMDVFTIAIGGGEPFLHPHLFEIASYARQKRVVSNITTNGLLIDAETARKCSVFGSVHVSCHYPSDLPRLADAVRALKKANIDVGLNVLASSSTYEKLPGIWKWCAKQGISRILLLKFKITGTNHDCHDLMLSAEQEQSLFPLIRKLSRRHSIMPLLDCSLFPALAYSWPRKKDLKFFDVNGCVGGNAILAITTDGYFKPCSFCQTPCGDARLLDRNTWKENKELAEFRQYRAHESCRTCTYESLCNGGCRIAATDWCLGPSKE
ncbi:MAG: radical SAM protein [Planctomycetia bacterium]